MEESEVVGLSRLKESVAPSDLDRTPDVRPRPYYPFATVLRLRVLQIVCGISFLIIGTVAFIEEKGKMNLGLGIPAGGATILAAAASIHTTKGFGGYRTSTTCYPNSSLRFLGPSVKIAVPLTILWATACSLVAILMLQSSKVLSCYQDEVCISDPAQQEQGDLVILAFVELLLAVLTFLAVFMLFRIDCKYDPD